MLALRDTELERLSLVEIDSEVLRLAEVLATTDSETLMLMLSEILSEVLTEADSLKL